MAKIKKIGRRTDQRKALIRGLATDLLWYGQIETTVVKAKAVRSYAEKLLTKAINTYLDTVKVTKTVVNKDGSKSEVEVINDGAKKLAARRAIMAKLYDVKEQKQEGESKAAFVARTKDIKHPLMEKIFNVYAPKYAQRKKETGQGGGYTAVIKTGTRRGDNAEMAILKLI